MREEKEQKEEKEEKEEKNEMAKKARAAKQKLDTAVEVQFQSGCLTALISSRPGQSGRPDGYVLEGEELAFYQRKLEKRKKG